MQTATNPQTGERVQWNGSAWVPLNGSASPAPPQQMPGPITLGTPRPKKPEIRQVGNQLGRVDDQGNFTPTYTAPDKPGSGGAKTIPSTAAAGIQANLETLRSLDATIASLDKRPQSIGPGTGALGDTFTQFNDPQGTDVRARVGKTGAYTIHDLSGAAVSASEAPRFTPFVPSVTDRPEVAKEKLKGFREALQAQIKESLDYYGPNNGYMPYDTPQAKVFREGGFGLQEDNSVKHLTPEQEAAYNALVQSGATADQIRAYGKQINFNFDNADAVVKARGEGAGFVGAESGKYNRPEDVQIRINQRANDAGVAAAMGATDAGTMGFNDEIAAGADAAIGALQGQGSFGNLYDQNIQVERGFKNNLQSNQQIPYLAGQFAGGAALPGFGVKSVGGLAALGAGYGGAYGLGSGTDAQSRLSGLVLGGATGAGIGAGAGKLSQMLANRAAPAEVPGLVDQAGRLNEPLEQAGPAGRVAAAKDFGIDLPMGSAGDRTAAIIERGLDNLPGSAGVMNDSRRVVEGQVQNAVENVANKFGSSRTLNEGGAELQRGAADRIERGKAVISKAYEAIPISDQAKASTNNTVSTLESLTGRFQSNPDLAESLKDPKLVGYLNAMQKGLSWKDLKDFRTIIGEKIGEMRFGESSSTSDLRALYAGLSEDMRNTAAAQGPGALRAFERANSLNRNNEQVIQGALTRILGKDGQMAPEKAALAVQAMTKGGKATGDLKTLSQIRNATMKSGAWDEIASTLIRLGGQPANSPGRAFDPKVFVQWYSDMAEPARALLFKPELRSTLDKFVAVNQRLANSNALRNTSNTTPTLIGAGFVGGTLTTAVNDPKALIALGIAAGANFGAGKLWTSPAFVRWATGYAKAAASGSENAVRSQIGQLPKLATKNPNLREALIRLQQSLANDNLPRAGQAVASPDQGPEQQQ